MPDPRPWVTTIPVVPPSLNEWKKWHWAKQRKAREAFQEQVWAALNEHGNRCPRGLERVELRFALSFRVARRRDADNFGALLHKFTQDVLVQQGVIPDDTHDRCTAYPPRIVLGEREQTVIVIKPMEVERVS
jgi:hypothetical protein